MNPYFDQADADSDLLRSLFAASDIPDPLDVLHHSDMLGRQSALRLSRRHRLGSGAVGGVVGAGSSSASRLYREDCFERPPVRPLGDHLGHVRVRGRTASYVAQWVHYPHAA